MHEDHLLCIIAYGLHEAGQTPTWPAVRALFTNPEARAGFLSNPCVPNLAKQEVLDWLREARASAEGELGWRKAIWHTEQYEHNPRFQKRGERYLSFTAQPCDG